MGKRALLNIWMAVALVALVWVVWQEPGHAPKPAAAKLTALTPDEVSSVVITNRHGTISFSKRDGHWWMMEPVKLAANAVRIDSLLQVTQAESQSHFPSSGKDLAQFGLVKPAVTLRLNGLELLFGGVTPVDQRRYVKVGDAIHLINDNYFFDLSGEAAAFASRDLVPKEANLASIQLPDAKLTRTNKDEWTVTPAKAGISKDAVQAVVSAWRDGQALRVASYDKRPGQGAVILGFNGGQAPLRYEIIARKPELILARPEIGMQFYLAGDEAERLLSVSQPAKHNK